MSEFISVESLFRNHLMVAVGIAYLAWSWVMARRDGLSGADFAALPSCGITLLTICIWAVPVYVAAASDDFLVPHLRTAYYDRTQTLILLSTFSLLGGMGLVRYVMAGRADDSAVPERPMDYPWNDTVARMGPMVLSWGAVIVFPFCIAFRFDLIAGGGLRRFDTTGTSMGSMMAAGQIAMSLLSILAGVYYGYYRKLVLLPVMFDVLQMLAKLSRGFFIPLAFFLLAAHLAGRRFPMRTFITAGVVAILLSAAALATRGAAKQLGGQSIGTGVELLAEDPGDSFSGFVRANTIAGLLSVAVKYAPTDTDFVAQAWEYTKSVLPIPSFVGLTPEHLSIAKLIGTTHAGLPMMMLGEVYYRFGYAGCLIYFAIGAFFGLVETNLVRHLRVHARAYWPHILIYLASLYGYVLGFHSPSRRASRFLIYAVLLIAAIRFVCGVRRAANENSAASFSQTRLGRA